MLFEKSSELDTSSSSFRAINGAPNNNSIVGRRKLDTIVS